VGQDKALINVDFVLDLYILSHYADSFNSNPLPHNALPTNNAIPDEGMTLYGGFTQD